MPDDRRWSNDPDLRLWAVEVTGPPKRGGYMRNKTIYVGAPSITAAIQSALDEYDNADAWVVSASHRGPIHKVVDA